MCNGRGARINCIGVRMNGRGARMNCEGVEIYRVGRIRDIIV